MWEAEPYFRETIDVCDQDLPSDQGEGLLGRLAGASAHLWVAVSVLFPVTERGGTPPSPRPGSPSRPSETSTILGLTWICRAL